LCLDCHTDTQIKGGFHRKLTSDQIILYRDDWIQIVSKNRAKGKILKKDESKELNFKRLTTTIDVFRDKNDFVSLAMMYDTSGNSDLRDKYIELAIKNKLDDTTIIFLRSIQNKINLIPEDVKKRVINRQIKDKEWNNLARTFLELGDYKEAVKNYCKSVMEDLENGNIFSAAFYLKELTEEELHASLFEEDYQNRIKDKDLYWQIRCSEELGWYDEAITTLLKNKKKIEIAKSGILVNLKEKLALCLGDEEKYLELVKKGAETEAESSIKKKK